MTELLAVLSFEDFISKFKSTDKQEPDTMLSLMENLTRQMNRSDGGSDLGDEHDTLSRRPRPSQPSHGRRSEITTSPATTTHFVIDSVERDTDRPTNADDPFRVEFDEALHDTDYGTEFRDDDDVEGEDHEDFDELANGDAEMVERRRTTLRNGESEAPSMDVFRNREEYVVLVDVPGVSPPSLDVRTCGRAIRVFGHRPDPVVPSGPLFRCNFPFERKYGTFVRRILCRADADLQNVEAHYKDGLLSLRVPRRPNQSNVAVSSPSHHGRVVLTSQNVPRHVGE